MPEWLKVVRALLPEHWLKLRDLWTKATCADDRIELLQRQLERAEEKLKRYEQPAVRRGRLMVRKYPVSRYGWQDEDVG